MTSDSDKLEEALRENLKLRRELAANVTKAETVSQRRGMTYRLGWVLYWTCLALALLSALAPIQVLTNELGFSASGFPRHFAVIGALVALVLYGLGRTFRYVLSGE